MATMTMTERAEKVMKDPSHIRNLGVSAHIDHGKSTFSDNLLLGAGMISEELAGKQRVTDFREDEIERGITIDSANVSMVHTLDGEDYLINLIDTPGHVDFGGDVTRAMRAVDGTIIVVCAVEGMMPQTETVLRQALKERDKPILFINKVDRLIKELQLTPEKMQERFVGIINRVNSFIKKIATDETNWQVNVQDGSVCFGSAFHKWALSVPYMKRKGISFKDIIDAYNNDKSKELVKKAPLHEVILEAVVRHLPNPVVAQKYRIPKIWHGDKESSTGKALLNCDPNGPVAFSITKVVIDKHAGEVCAGRLFSGTLKKGMQVYMILSKKHVRVQQVSIYKAAQRLQVEEAYPGNIVGVVGLAGGFAGESVTTDENMEPFEAISHIFEPVVTKAIEAMRPSDLPKLIEVLKQVEKEDPSIHIEINEATGEHLMSGMGELHLEVIENRIKSEKNVDVKTSNPIVVYRENVLRPSPSEAEGKSPNKHNKLYFTVQPLEKNMVEAIRSGELPELRLKKKDREIVEKLVDLGMDNKEARNVKDIYKGNIFVDDTRGVVQIGEIMELVLDMFEEVMRAGPLAHEPCIGMKVYLHDAKLHEDAIHRGPGQMYPCVRDGIREAIAIASPVLFEPVQKIQFNAPSDYMGEISKVISNRRGQLINMQQEGEEIVVEANMPVAETFGLSNDLRSSTGGRGSQFLMEQSFERLPGELQNKVVSQLKQRKGLSDAQTL